MQEHLEISRTSPAYDLSIKGDQNIIDNIVDKNVISDAEIYRLAINDKQRHEDKRGEINSYYTMLFSGIVGIAPFIINILGKEKYIIKILLIFLSLIGLILASVWIANLKRILFHLESLEKILVGLEKKHHYHFITTIMKDLEDKRSPGRLTKYQMLIPASFIISFIGIIAWCVIEILN